MSKKEPFGLDDIEDVRILLEVKGKHYSIVPKSDKSKDEAKMFRKSIGIASLLYHDIVETPLEDLKTSKFLKNKI